ncbi:Phr family secreted Rap phosphatase inhibitor [Bacillus cereus group sp. BfR-BA-01363]|uniref:Phr family secreted Rap phosphatase inhibitor n=1 Tax=Bacillus cereus group sp. BfR-BA-01363 TaxID=3094882 RepID=UPI0029C2188E|nr:Phr family secreted Rap phosphatase inhibitor [Bacillus cereus group sp. BfR-BA-01363]MDX5853405.1 Phr family secreted Rap phosphatase inhibitor [Bacillus cereus group sp. BfR-BA-01363]
MMNKIKIALLGFVSVAVLSLGLNSGIETQKASSVTENTTHVIYYSHADIW